MTSAPVAAAPKKSSRLNRNNLPMTLIVTLIPVCVALNIVGGYIASALRLPVYLDMIGTAISAIVLGPWWGALVGVLTNGGSALISGPVSLPNPLRHRRVMISHHPAQLRISQPIQPQP